MNLYTGTAFRPTSDQEMCSEANETMKFRKGILVGGRTEVRGAFF